MKTKVMIVDDHPMAREGLTIRIDSQPDLEVCAQADDVAGAMEVIRTVRPEVVVVDIQLKTGDGLDLVRRIKAHDPSIRMLVLSMYPDALYAQRALHAGALGYINKEHTTGRIVEAIRHVRDGKIYVCEETAAQLLGQSLGSPSRLPASGVDSLTDRELQVFRGIGAGLGTSAIAHRMRVSVHTVETHRQRIKRKLNLKTPGELSQAAVQWVLENKQVSIDAQEGSR